MVSADTIFSRFSITLAQFLGGMVVEMAPKPSKREEHIYSKRLRPKNIMGKTSAVYIQCLANRYGIFARNLFVFFVYCKQKVCLHFDIHSAAVQ